MNLSEATLRGLRLPPRPISSSESAASEGNPRPPRRIPELVADRADGQKAAVGHDATEPVVLFARRRPGPVGRQSGVVGAGPGGAAVSGYKDRPVAHAHVVADRRGDAGEGQAPVGQRVEDRESVVTAFFSEDDDVFHNHGFRDQPRA